MKKKANAAIGILALLALMLLLSGCSLKEAADTEPVPIDVSSSDEGKNTYLLTLTEDCDIYLEFELAKKSEPYLTLQNGDYREKYETLQSMQRSVVSVARADTYWVRLKTSGRHGFSRLCQQPFRVYR